jgi:hypothetical protein
MDVTPKLLLDQVGLRTEESTIESHPHPAPIRVATYSPLNKAKQRNPSQLSRLLVAQSIPFDQSLNKSQS